MPSVRCAIYASRAPRDIAAVIRAGNARLQIICVHVFGNRICS
jgi:hypothetical protein